MDIKTKENLIDEVLWQSKAMARDMKELTELIIKGDKDNYKKCILILKQVKIRTIESIDYLTDILNNIN